MQDLPWYSRLSQNTISGFGMLFLACLEQTMMSTCYNDRRYLTLWQAIECHPSITQLTVIHTTLVITLPMAYTWTGELLWKPLDIFIRKRRYISHKCRKVTERIFSARLDIDWGKQHAKSWRSKPSSRSLICLGETTYSFRPPPPPGNRETELLKENLLGKFPPSSLR
jgi:hypothetical protein